MQTNKDNILKHNFSLIDKLSNQNKILQNILNDMKRIGTQLNKSNFSMYCKINNQQILSIPTKDIALEHYGFADISQFKDLLCYTGLIKLIDKEPYIVLKEPYNTTIWDIGKTVSQTIYKNGEEIKQCDIYWTQNGRLLIYKTLAELGIYPHIIIN